MDEKISSNAIEQYSEEYASKLAGRFFENKEKITGPEILLLCEIKQVNLFVIRELIRIWSLEAEKLKSPYFNYRAEAVIEAITLFQNILSNHISITKADLLPLLRTAVAKTIHLILAPYDFYSETLDRHGKGYLKTDVLMNEVKYLKINKAPLEKLVLKLKERNSELITGNEAFGMLDHILEEVNFTPEDFDGYQTEFSKLVPFQVEKFYGQKSPPKVSATKKEDLPKPTPTEVDKERKSNLVDSLAKQKVVRLKDSLSINQKFMFTKILFKGDFEVFSEAVDQIDSLETLNHALAHIGEYYPEWDRESEEYEEFTEVLKKRFN